MEISNYPTNIYIATRKPEIGMCYYNGVKVSRTEFIRLKEIERDLRAYDLSTPLIDGFEYGPTSVIKPNKDYCDWDIVKNGVGLYP